MDYYEELGIERRASSAEIRHAYRRLVKLIHPDHFGTEPERKLAELQVKRLNGIMAVLSDPVERERYDLTLDTTAPAVRRISPQPRRRFAVMRVLAALAACAGVILLSDRLPRPTAPGTESVRQPGDAKPAPATPPADSDGPVPQAVERTEKLPPSRKPVTKDYLIPGRIPELPGREPPPGDRPIPALPIADISPPKPPSIEPVPAGTAPTLAGDWLYVPPAGKLPVNGYAPEYIDLRVVENSGRLQGRYRARYRVKDQAISPSVAFQFEGPAATPETAELTWTGVGGAMGNVKLRLAGNGTLEVNWSADRLGTELGLISGSAALVRKLE